MNIKANLEERIAKVINHIEENIHISLTLNDLSNVACLSVSHFHRTFRQITGLSPQKFALRLRMEQAYVKLIEGKILVQQLAVDLGYNDYETFSRAFKKYHSISPDDLKAIAGKVKERVGELDPELKLLVVATESDDQQELTDIIARRISQMDLGAELMEKDAQHHAFIIQEIPKDQAIDPKNSIKNKFEIQASDKLWKILVSK